MEVSAVLDIVQEIMEQVLGHLEIHFDDLVAFSDSWEHRLESLDKILTVIRTKALL